MATKTKFIVGYTKSRPTKLSRIEHALSSPTKLPDFVGRQNRAIFA